MSQPSLFILIFSGFLGAVIAAAISAFVARGVKISEFRQAWINDLRKDMADYIGAAERWFRKYEEINSELDNTVKGKRIREESFPLENEARAILQRIKLRINPRDDNPTKKADDLFLGSLEALLNPGKPEPPNTESSWGNLMGEAVRQGRELLKREWEVTKHPSWYGFMARRSTAIILLGLLLSTGGAAWAAEGVIINKTVATELASTKWGMNLELRRSLIRQSRDARNGLILVALGSAFQIAGLLLARGSPPSSQPSPPRAAESD